MSAAKIGFPSSAARMLPGVCTRVHLSASSIDYNCIPAGFPHTKVVSRTTASGPGGTAASANTKYQ